MTSRILLLCLAALAYSGCCATTTEIVDREVPVYLPPVHDTLLVDDVPEPVLEYLESLQAALERANGVSDSLAYLLAHKPATGLPRTFSAQKVTDRADTLDATFHYPRYFDLGIRYAPRKATVRDTTNIVHVDEYSLFAKIGYAVLFLMAGFVLGIVILALMRK